MNTVKWLAVLFALLALPLICIGESRRVQDGWQIYWDSHDYDTFSAEFRPPGDKRVDKYLKKGLTVRYEFKFRLCRHRSWLDRCQESYKERHEVSYDPLLEKYAVSIQRMGKSGEIEDRRFSSLDEALRYASRVERFPIKPLRADRPIEKLVKRSKYYLGAKLKTKALGDSKNVLEVLSYIFTFGQVDLAEFDSGWKEVDFRKIPVKGEI